MPDKPPFIATQRILLLDEDVDDPRRFLRPEAFRAARIGNSESGNPSRTNPDADRWYPVDPTALFGNDEIRRLCITTDAGIGKTTRLKWAEQHITCSSNDQPVLAIYVELSELPDGREAYSRSDFLSVLLKRLRQASGNEELDEQAGHQLLHRLLAQGRLVLLVDALDQTNISPARGRNPKVTALKDFLAIDARRCMVVIAGRPHAVDRYWSELFAQGQWRFAQIDHLIPAEQKQYLGEARYARLKGMDVEILAVPRALQTIRQIDLSQLGTLRTASDIYLRCAETMLEKGLNVDAVRRTGLQMPEALWFLSAIAFAMVCDGNFEGVATGPFKKFRKKLWDDRGGDSELADFEQFKRYLKYLGQTNEILDHGFLEGWGLKQVFWRNRSLQEFFAGYWLANYCTEEDAQRLGDWIYLPDVPASGEYYWVWRFAAEMPTLAMDAESWSRAMEVLYRPGDDTAEGTQRSTEMIYRSWVTMEEATRPAEETHDRTLKAIVALYQERCLLPYRAEFSEVICTGQRDEELADGANRAGIAGKLLSGFCRIPLSCSSPSDLKFKMGEDLHDASVPGVFKLHRYVVTNEEYELYDPGHRKKRGKHSPADRCPVIRVNWYDAWAYCLWLGPDYYLPNIHEWEFACRAGSETAYCFGNDERELGNYAWYDRNSDDHAHPVGEKKANAWGLYDMHGNVREMCDSWREPLSSLGTYSLRIHRGGSWVDDARDCRTASRSGGRPGFWSEAIGFRVASVRGERGA